MQEPITLIISAEDEGHRLDVFLSKELPDVTRSMVQSWIKAGLVTASDVTLNASHKLKEGTVLCVQRPEAVAAEPLPVQMDLDIVYEDSDVLVINKPVGLVVHPGAGHMQDTLVNGLLHHCDDLSGIGGVMRPGIVHRLDKDTSGLMVVAKHDKAHHVLSKQFEEKGQDNGLIRKYVGFVWGAPNPLKGQIETFMGRDYKNRQKMMVLKAGGKWALTFYETIKRYSQTSTISKIIFTLATGRTHQIRVHCQHHKIPMLGDSIYGSKKGKEWGDEVHNFPRQALHACYLQFIHPVNGDLMVFEAPLPPDLQTLEEILDEKSRIFLSSH